MNTPRTFTIVTFGCQMNKSDSELMELSLLQAGFIKINTNADIIIFNTCSVRKHAEDRAIAHIIKHEMPTKMPLLWLPVVWRNGWPKIFAISTE